MLIDDWLASHTTTTEVTRAVAAARRDLDGPLRVGACTLAAPAPCEHAPVAVSWPVVGTGAGVDLCFLIHSGRLPAAAAARVRADIPGPAVYVVATAAEITPELISSLRPEVARAREAMLAAHCEALAYRFPAARGLAAFAAPRTGGGPTRTVVVTGPQEAPVQAVAESLRGIVVVADVPDPDCVVAVAPPEGWGDADLSGLPRPLVVTAPGPADATVCPTDHLASWLPDHLARTQSRAPAVPTRAWRLAARTLTSWTVAAVPAPRPGAVVRSAPVQFAVAVVLGLLTAVVVGQPVVGVLVGGVRWWMVYRTARAELHAQLRDATLRHPGPAVDWLRHQATKASSYI